MSWDNIDIFSEFPKFDEWCLSCKDTTSKFVVPFKVGQHSTPPFPTSEDYYQFCDVLKYEHDSLEALFLFHELFTINSNNSVTGLNDYQPYNYADFTLRDYHSGHIANLFHEISEEDWINKYDKIHPWADYIKRKFVIYKHVPHCIIFIHDLLRLKQYKFFYANKFISEAIKYNFAEDDPDRNLLLKQINLEKDFIPTEPRKWYCSEYDYDTEFDPEILVTLKPGLVTYANMLNAKTINRDDDFDEWYQSALNSGFYQWHQSALNSEFKINVPSNIGQYLPPPFPTSEDYKQFCDFLSYEIDSLDALVMFHELFTRDANDCITGLTDYNSFNMYKIAALNSMHEDRLMLALCRVRVKNWIMKYNKLSPWMDDLWCKFLCSSPCSPLVRCLYALFCTGRNRFFYFNRLVSDAIKHNFAKDDPDRELLLKHVNLKNDKIATDTRKWYRATRDFSTEFDPVFLSSLKPGLVAYADDLKTQAIKYTTRD